MRKLSEIEQDLQEYGSKMEFHRKEFFIQKKIVQKLLIELSEKKENILDIKIGDYIKLTRDYGSETFYFRKNSVIEITKITDKFISGRLDRDDCYGNNKFRVSKKKFYSMLSICTPLGEVIKRDGLIEDLLE